MLKDMIYLSDFGFFMKYPKESIALSLLSLLFYLLVLFVVKKIKK